jgi:hypothetical protein
MEVFALISFDEGVYLDMASFSPKESLNIIAYAHVTD